MPSIDHGIAEQFTPNNVWASTVPDGSEEELTLPSGQTCRAKKMSIESMISAGLLAESDAVTAMVTKHVKKVKGSSKKVEANQVDVGSLMRDPKAVTDMIGMVDRIIPHVVVSPIVRLHYTEQTVGKTKVTKMIPPKDRDTIRAENPDEVIVFTDQIGLEDKMWLFDWAAGGLGAMLAFRE